MNLYNSTREAAAALARGDTKTTRALLAWCESILSAPGNSDATDKPIARCCFYVLDDGRIHCGEDEVDEDGNNVPARGERRLFLGTPRERRGACQFCAATCRAQLIEIESVLQDTQTT